MSTQTDLQCIARCHEEQQHFPVGLRDGDLIHLSEHLLHNKQAKDQDRPALVLSPSRPKARSSARRVEAADLTVAMISVATPIRPLNNQTIDPQTADQTVQAHQSTRHQSDTQFP